MNKSFGQSVIQFNKKSSCDIQLPEGLEVMNPFQNNAEGLRTMTEFYNKFYNDCKTRSLILGINPGRFGAGLTGVPFTDTKRLKEFCGIDYNDSISHEPSTTFIYKLVEHYGGVETFFGDFYIQSIFPLALIRKNEKGNFVNCNYYDYKWLFERLKPFMVKHLRKQINLGINTDTVFIFGKKNSEYFNLINKEEHLFKNFIVLEHPRYIQQYKSKQSDEYAKKFSELLKTKK